MFFVYLLRELRRRMRQAVFIALGLALGVGLVITVTAASDGVKNSQAAVLHALYGVGTDLTVTQAPAAGLRPGRSPFGFRQEIQKVRGGEVAAGTKIRHQRPGQHQYGTLSRHVAGDGGPAARRDRDVAGGLVSTTTRSPGRSRRSASAARARQLQLELHHRRVHRGRVDLAHTSLGPLSSARVPRASTLTAADANADDAVLDSNYAAAEQAERGGTVDVGGTNFKIIGIVSVPQGGNPPDVYIPLAKAQSIGKSWTAQPDRQGEHDLRVGRQRRRHPGGAEEIGHGCCPTATVTDSSDLASEVTGSLASAVQPGEQPGHVAVGRVLIAAFLRGQPADDGRGDPPGPGVRHAEGARLADPADRRPGAWASRWSSASPAGRPASASASRGAALIDKLAPKLSATVGRQPAARPAGGRQRRASSALRRWPAHRTRSR